MENHTNNSLSFEKDPLLSGSVTRASRLPKNARSFSEITRTFALNFKSMVGLSILILPKQAQLIGLLPFSLLYFFIAIILSFTSSFIAISADMIGYNGDK